MLDLMALGELSSSCSMPTTMGGGGGGDEIGEFRDFGETFFFGGSGGELKLALVLGGV